MSREIATIQDDDGDVWTGRVEDTTDWFDTAARIFVGFGTCGLTELLPGEDKITVVVNGVEHRGYKV